MPCPNDSDMAAYVDGTASAELRERVDLHLDDCAQCQQAVLELLRLNATSPPTEGLRTLSGPPRLLPPGSSIGRFLVLTHLGTGGMGVVYAAYDPQLDRKIALKLLHPQLVSEVGQERARTRLLSEARALAGLAHPNVVSIHDVLTVEDRVAIAMEFVDGVTLRQSNPRPWRQARDLFVAAGRGLAAAHAAGLVHRDFKPDNVILGRDGRVRVTDFGLATRILETQAPVGETLDAPSDTMSASPVGHTEGIAGTPSYMAPEQRRGLPADARSDQFSFCVAFYEVVCGRLPYGGATEKERRRQSDRWQVNPPPRGVTMPRWLWRVLLRGLNPEPDARFASMQELVGHLTFDTKLRRRWGVAAAALVAAGLFATSVTAWLDRSSPCVAPPIQEQVWTTAVRDSSRSAFAATGLPYAAQSWSQLDAALERYLATWETAYRQACDATRRERTQPESLLDLRIACLEHRRHQVEALVDLLDQADRALVQRAPAAIAGLPLPNDCANIEWLLSRVKPPTDIEQRARVDVLRRQTARISALAASGRFESAWELANETHEAAVALAYAPLIAETAILRGSMSTWARSDFDAGERELQHGVDTALASGHFEAAADGLGQLVFLVGVGRGRPEEAHRLGRHAEALLTWIDAPELRLARVWGRRGVVYAAYGQLDEALEFQQRALDLRRTILSANHPDVAYSLYYLGDLHHDRGDYPAALQHYRQAEEVFAETVGAAHPQALLSRARQGMVLHHLGNLNQAIGLLGGAEAALAESLDPHHAALAMVRDKLGDALQRDREYSRALHLHRLARDGAEQSLGPKHAAVARALTLMATAEIALGELDDAEEHLRAALHIREGARKPDSVDLAATHSGLGKMWEARGNLKRAESRYTHAWAVLENDGKAKNPRAVRHLLALARAHMARGRVDVARSRAKQILEIAATAEMDPSYPEMARQILGSKNAE